MTKSETAQMLCVFRDYWPTYTIRDAEGGLPSTVDTWAAALAEYPIDEVRRALLVFRGQSERVFAPTMSEFEGLLREFAAEQVRSRLALPAPDTDEPEGEWYDYEAGPKQKDGSWTKHRAYRCTPAGRKRMIEWYAKVRATPAKKGKKPGPLSGDLVLDERHDWAKTFAQLDTAKQADR